MVYLIFLGEHKQRSPRFSSQLSTLQSSATAGIFLLHRPWVSSGEGGIEKDYGSRNSHSWIGGRVRTHRYLLLKEVSIVRKVQSRQTLTVIDQRVASSKRLANRGSSSPWDSSLIIQRFPRYLKKVQNEAVVDYVCLTWAFSSCQICRQSLLARLLDST